jgi:hypothetical protein
MTLTRVRRPEPDQRGYHATTVVPDLQQPKSVRQGCQTLERVRLDDTKARAELGTAKAQLAQTVVDSIEQAAAAAARGRAARVRDEDDGPLRERIARLERQATIASRAVDLVERELVEAVIATADEWQASLRSSLVEARRAAVDALTFAAARVEEADQLVSVAEHVGALTNGGKLGAEQPLPRPHLLADGAPAAAAIRQLADDLARPQAEPEPAQPRRTQLLQRRLELETEATRELPAHLRGPHVSNQQVNAWVRGYVLEHGGQAVADA